MQVSGTVLSLTFAIEINLELLNLRSQVDDYLGSYKVPYLKIFIGSDAMNQASAKQTVDCQEEYTTGMAYGAAAAAAISYVVHELAKKSGLY